MGASEPITLSRACEVVETPSGIRGTLRFVAKTRSIPEVQGFRSAARFPVTRYRVEKGQPIVEYQEYGLSWRPLLRVVLNERQEVLAAGWIEH